MHGQEINPQAKPHGKTFLSAMEGVQAMAAEAAVAGDGIGEWVYRTGSGVISDFSIPIFSWGNPKIHKLGVA